MMGMKPTNVDAKDDLNHILRLTIEDAYNWLWSGDTHKNGSVVVYWF